MIMEMNNRKIVVVEDSPTQSLQLQHVLEKSGFQVTAVGNGKEALKLLESVSPMLVISDVLMPEMDGYELCKRLRADARFKDLPVVLVTTLSDPKDVIRGLECGANNFIIKPYDEKYLLNRIQYLLSNFELRKNSKAEMGINVFFSGENYFITAERLQILDLLLSTYENAYHQNIELTRAQNDLRDMNERLEDIVKERTSELLDANKRLNAELAERRQAEQALKCLKNQYEMLLQAAGDGIIGQDNEGKITFINPAAEKMLGYSSREMIGRPSHETWHNSRTAGDAYSKEECLIIKACREGRTYSGTNEVFWRKDGTSFPVEYIATPLRENGGVEGMVVIFRDITQARRLQETEVARIAADSANRAKSDFLANMSHELRTPLNSVIGFSEVLRDELFGELNEKQKEYVSDILAGGRHLLSLINDILDLSKVESGKLELELGRFQLRDVLNSAMTMFREKAMKHNLKLELDIRPDADAEVEADERKLKQIMFNLISNAVKFTPDGGSVRVSARKVSSDKFQALSKDKETATSDKLQASSNKLAACSLQLDRNFIEVSVIDTGIGIKPDDIPKLFTEFTQLESVYTKKIEGTGLGLALTKRLIELHGGSIRLESEFGKGSTFSFVIPVIAKAEEDHGTANKE